MNKFECIVTIVDGGYSENVVEAAKKAGAKGATVINARGSSVKEPNKFFKLNIQPDKQIVLILTNNEQTKTIVEMIAKEAGMNTRSHALSFVLPVEDAVGLAEIFKEKTNKEA